MLETLTDANTETDSSTAQDASTESSAVETTSSKTQSKTLLEVVQEAAERAGSKEESSTSEDEDQEGSVQKLNETKEGDKTEDVVPEGETEDDDEGAEEEEDAAKDVPFHNHPRWKEVVSERDAAKTQLTEYEARVKELEPIATAHKSVVEYCERNQISPDDYRQALEFVALIKTDPAKAREKLLPIWEGLAAMTGDKLPADLQAEVDNQLIPLQRAQEIAKLRAQSTFESTKHKQTVEQIQQEKQQRFVHDAYSALQSWDTSHRKTDLDFAPKKEGEGNGKYEWFTMEMEALLRKSEPKTTQDIINLAEKAYESACKSFARFNPARKASKVLSTTRSSKTKQSQPKSIADVVRQTAMKHGLVMDED